MAGGFNPGPVDDLGASIDIDSDTLARTAMQSPAPVGLQSKGGSAKNGAAPLGAQVVNFARDRITSRVGDGQCFALADQALRNAGARSASDFGTVTPNADYVWGTQVNLSDVRPGDIIQFRNYRYDRRIETETSVDTDSQVRPHHTAIVETVGTDGAITVLEQNVPDGDPVRRSRLFFSNRNETSGGTTTTITVQGSFRFYRPQPR